MKYIIIFLLFALSTLSSCSQEYTMLNKNPKQVENQTKIQVDSQEEKNDKKNIQDIKSYNLGEEISIKIWEKISIHDVNLFLTFNELISDSRCPEWVECFWEGVAELYLNGVVSNDEIIQKIEISPSWEGALIYELWNGFKVEVLWLTPYPVNSEKIKEDEYVLRILITKKS